MCRQRDARDQLSIRWNRSHLDTPPVQLRGRVRRVFWALTGDDHGQDLIEYALLTGFISLVAVIAITQLGGGVNGAYGNIASVFSGFGRGGGLGCGGGAP